MVENKSSFTDMEYDCRCYEVMNFPSKHLFLFVVVTVQAHAGDVRTAVCYKLNKKDGLFCVCICVQFFFLLSLMMRQHGSILRAHCG